MTARLMIATVVLAGGCDRWSNDCDATWSIALERDGSPSEGADARAAVGPDGTITVAISDPFSAVRFGDTVFAKPTIARVSAVGEILNTAPGGPETYALAVGIDDAGNSVVVWGTISPHLVAYSPDLSVRWERTLTGGVSPGAAFDVSSSGDVAFVVQSDPFAVEGDPRMDVHLVAADGTPRWTIDLFPMQQFVGMVRIADNGDVLAFGGGPGGPRRWRFAASDGSLVDEAAAQDSPLLIDRDGGAIAVILDGDIVSLARFDPQNSVVWRTEVDGLAFGGDLLATAGNGDLLVFTATTPSETGNQHFDVLRLDRNTGERLGSVETCDFGYVAGGDERGVVTRGPIGSQSSGLSRYDD